MPFGLERSLEPPHLVDPRVSKQLCLERLVGRGPLGNNAVVPRPVLGSPVWTNGSKCRGTSNSSWVVALADQWVNMRWGLERFLSRRPCCPVGRNASGPRTVLGSSPLLTNGQHVEASSRSWVVVLADR